MHTLPLVETGSMLVYVPPLPDGRKSNVGTCSNPACWQMSLLRVCICTNMLADVATSWYMYQPAGAVYL